MYSIFKRYLNILIILSTISNFSNQVSVTKLLDQELKQFLLIKLK